MTDSDSKSPDAHGLDESTLHDLLSSERRRHALDCLTDHGPMALPDLADEVAAREHDELLSQVPEDAVLTTYLSLYHTHVPKLQTADVVDYDQDSDLVALADDASTLDAYAARDSVVGAD